MSLPPPYTLARGAVDCAAIVGGSVVAWFQVWGPVLSGVSAIVAIVWGFSSLYYLFKRERKNK